MLCNSSPSARPHEHCCNGGAMWEFEWSNEFVFNHRGISMRLLIRLIHFQNACHLPSHSKVVSFFHVFFFSLNTCFKMLQSGCWLLLCFSPSLSFFSVSLSLPCKCWVIYLWHELDVSVRQARRYFISPKVAGYRFHYLLILWFLRGFAAVQELMLPLCHVQKIKT